MSKKTIKTIEELTEEFFAAERAEYEKRVPAAFPRVAVKALSESGEPADEAPVEEEPSKKGEEESVRSTRQ